MEGKETDNPAEITSADFWTLLNIAIPFAKDMLQKHTGFHPFGMTVSSDGQAELFAADMGSAQPSTAAIDALTGGFRDKATAGEIRAACVCFDAGARLPGYPDLVDTICCRLDHRNGAPVDMFVPYRKEPGHVRFDDTVGLAGTPTVFAAGANSG